MLLLRLIVFAGLIGVGVSGVLYLATRDPRYLRFAGALLKFAVVFLLVFAALFVIERLVLI